MIFLPEIRLKRIIDSLLNYLKEDLKINIDHNTENESYLYLLFHESKEDTTFSVNYKEAKQIFLRVEADPRYLKVSPIFDRRRAQVPTIHIVVPQDGEEYRQIGDAVGEFYDIDNFIIEKRGRAFQTQFNLITTSDNITEVLLINYVLRALLIGAVPQLEYFGFINSHISTQDLNINPDLFPANAYIKGILLTAAYPEIVPEVGKNPKIKTIIFDEKEIIYG